MRPARFIRLTVGVLAATGCHATAPAVTPRATTALPEIGRAVTAPDVTQVAAILPVDANDPGPYLELGAEECRRLAAANSAPARLLEEAARSPAPKPLRGDSSVDDLRRALASDLAAEARNRTAAAALEAYYRLFEAEVLADALQPAVAELDALNRSLDALAQSGLPEPADAPRLRSRRFSVRAERETAKAGARRLSAELLPAIGAAADAGRVNPTDLVAVAADDLDANQAVAFALAARPDVRAARTLARGVDSRTAGAVRAALGALTPGLPDLPGGVGARLVTICRAPDDLPARAAGLVADRERAAESAVRGAVADYNSARAAVGAAKVLQAQEAARVTSEAAREGAGVSGGTAALRAAKLAQIEADVGAIRAAVRWKLADVAVRRELGILGGS